MELKEDFLEADREIRGQNYVCLSFISPENILQNKNIRLNITEKDKVIK